MYRICFVGFPPTLEDHINQIDALVPEADFEVQLKLWGEGQADTNADFFLYFIKDSNTLGQIPRSLSHILIIDEEVLWNDLMSKPPENPVHFVKLSTPSFFKNWVKALVLQLIDQLKLQDELHFTKKLLQDEIDSRIRLLSKQKSIQDNLYDSFKGHSRKSLNDIVLRSTALKNLVLDALSKVERLTQNKQLDADIRLFEETYCKCDAPITTKALEILISDVLKRIEKNSKIQITSEIREHEMVLLINIPEECYIDQYVFQEVFLDENEEETIAYALFELAGIRCQERFDDKSNHEISLYFQASSSNSLSIETDNNKTKPTDFKLSLKGMRVLLTDDNDLNLMVSSKQLKDAGALVFEFDDSVDALEWAKENSFELGILDIKMPEMNGYELSEALLQNLKDAENKPVICLCTAYPDEVDLHKMSKSGVTVVIGKPFSIEELSKTLTEHFHI